jgi:hypothetical protein
MKRLMQQDVEADMGTGESGVGSREIETRRETRTAVVERLGGVVVVVMVVVPDCQWRGLTMEMGDLSVEAGRFLRPLRDSGPNTSVCTNCTVVLHLVLPLLYKYLTATGNSLRLARSL